MRSIRTRRESRKAVNRLSLHQFLKKEVGKVVLRVWATTYICALSVSRQGHYCAVFVLAY
jgi:hypothetical protein